MGAFTGEVGCDGDPLLGLLGADTLGGLTVGLLGEATGEVGLEGDCGGLEGIAFGGSTGALGGLFDGADGWLGILGAVPIGELSVGLLGEATGEVGLEGDCGGLEGLVFGDETGELGGLFDGADG